MKSRKHLLKQEVRAAATILILTGLLWRTRRRHRPAAEPESDTVEQQNSVPSLKQLIRHAKHAAPSAFRSELAAYLIRATQGNQVSALTAFCASSDNAKSAMAALDAACYGTSEFKEAHRKQISAALEQFARQLEQAPKAYRTDLPHLYPR